jgi:two-component system phosphate regulon response regulator PhoB
MSYYSRDNLAKTAVTASPKTTSPQRVLVVDDEPDITALVAYHLAKAGYRVSTATSGSEALHAAEDAVPDLVVLDLMLPGKSGYEVLHELRRRPETAAVGVILLTARREEADRIEGMERGADDYVVKPFSPQELVLRVGAVLRRLRAPSVDAGAQVRIGPLTIDRGAHAVSVDGEQVSLTATEYRLLLTLVERRGRVQSRSHLLETVWNAHPGVQTRTVDMHVKRLRQKLGAMADQIETVRGFGYRFRAERGAE